MIDTTPLWFLIPLEPLVQPRHRATAFMYYDKAKGKMACRAQIYEAPRGSPIRAYRQAVADWVADHYDGPPLDGPLTMRLLMILPRPASLIWKTKPMPRLPHAGKTKDYDNLVKSIQDALTGILWVDDGQIWLPYPVKMIAAGGEAPHIELTVSRTTQGDVEGVCGLADLYGTLPQTDVA